MEQRSKNYMRSGVRKMLRDLLNFFLRLISPHMFIGLNTRTIDAHINELKTQHWFNTLYQDEKYRKLFFTNVHIRHYLESKRRFNTLMSDPVAREKFVNLLEKQRKK